ncbi:MAG: ABC transporter substrate-binding protein [Candidatus Thorarchaeota archaeon]
MIKRELLGSFLLIMLTLFWIHSPFLLGDTQEGRIFRDYEWYYENFTTEDRKKIRQAFDYSIPRVQIIEDLLQGIGQAVATPLLANQLGYNSTIVPRDLNKTKALDLMEEVFGFRFNDSVEDPEDDDRYFQMVLITLATRQDRIKWAASITEALGEIGVEIFLKYGNRNVFEPRVLDPDPEVAGKDYAHGGMDGYFMGWEVNSDPDLTPWFLKAAQAPNGQNAHYIEDTTIEEILNRTLSNRDPQKRLDALQEFQQWFFNESPFYMVREGMNIIASDPALRGVDISGQLYPNYGNWSHANQTTVTVHSLGRFIDINPIVSISYFDKLATAGVFEGLLGRFPGKEEPWHGILAKRWTHSPDDLVWEVSIKEGIQFSNGANLTVDDVVFSYQRVLDPDVGSALRGAFTFFNEDAVEKINATAARFTFNGFWPYAENYLSRVPIVSEAEMSQLSDTGWDYDYINSEKAPIGSGPYKIDPSYLSAQEVHLVKNLYYNATLRGHNPENGIWYPNPSIDTIVVKFYDKLTTAIGDLQNDTVDIIDPHTFLVPYLDTINGSSWAKLSLTPAYEFEALFLNHYSPIWGLNPADPCEMYPGYCDDYPFDSPLIESFNALLTGVLVILLVSYFVLGLFMVKKRRS